MVTMSPPFNNELADFVSFQFTRTSPLSIISYEKREEGGREEWKEEKKC